MLQPVEDETHVAGRGTHSNNSMFHSSFVLTDDNDLLDRIEAVSFRMSELLLARNRELVSRNEEIAMEVGTLRERDQYHMDQIESLNRQHSDLLKRRASLEGELTELQGELTSLQQDHELQQSRIMMGISILATIVIVLSVTSIFWMV